MHVIFRESHGLEETETPIDLGQSPADLVVLSFSDSDLGAFAEAWTKGGGPEGDLPSLRLANLVALKHPLSVDTYVENTLSGARGILIRLIGGVPYWAYGLAQVRALAEARGIALAVLPADGQPDPQLAEYTTLPASTLERLKTLCDIGGVPASQAALSQLALAAGLYARPVIGEKTLPDYGFWTPETGVSHEALRPRLSDKPLIIITFYRSYLVAADTDPIEAMLRTFRARGYDVAGLFAPSLKAPAAAKWIAEKVAHLRPAAIVNATAFSGKGMGGTSPLDAAGVPVFQAALATSTEAAWDTAERGLSPADLAMNVVLPEVDGRIMGGVASFKEPGARDPQLEFSRFRHRAADGRVEALTRRVDGWLRLARTPVSERRLALVLSTYPGKDWNMGHAVGLDAFASARAMLRDLRAAGHDLGDELDPGTLAKGRIPWSLDAYQKALETLPPVLRDDFNAVWGPPEADGDFSEGAFHFAAVETGHGLVALQPERGTPEARKDDYHDLSRVPRHAYVAFYLWLQARTDALIHIGAHGTLEWLPGKAVALSEACWPEVLTGALPVIYPFIVNDPGEAAQAKRRIGAVTLGHVPPPIKESGTPERLAHLEALLDEFSNADGLDPKRRDRLETDIRSEAQALGVEEDLGIKGGASPADAITRIDRFVCDVKESQFGAGLHVWGQEEPSAPFETRASAEAERQSLRDALNGKRIAPGPAGSPYRGRTDVLPTGRNMFSVDPRSVPTRAAHAQGIRLADELIRRHLQDHGDWPKGLVVDLWGSATMRTAGEEFAMALHLLGARPVWDQGSERVSGVEILPLAELDRPRIDVTLRISGLFRDVFPTLSTLYGQAVNALAARDEAGDWNPFGGRTDLDRVYGPGPGSYGLAMGAHLDTFSEHARRAAGEAWLNASSWALDGAHSRQDRDGIGARVAAADAFVHPQDLPETDLLLAADYAAHEAGFAAAKAGLGGSAALYHLDNTDPSKPRARALNEEIARVVRARAANPDWIKGMRAHGFRGAAEIAVTLDHMAAFAHLAGAVAPHLFDLFHAASLGDLETERFLRSANPEAHRAMEAQFRSLLDAGLWVTRRNSVRAAVEASA
ncbi:MAG: cobaltochelatase subunit CobN [Pseudomonadota bacterium]